MNRDNLKHNTESQHSQFFAWRNSTGKIAKQRGYKDSKAKWWGRKDADYISVGKFKKGGCGKHRTLENLVSIDKVFSDVDSTLPLAWQELIAKCKKFNIPKPNLILRTSDNHYQPMWSIPEVPRDLLGLWECVQDGIYELFKEFGADVQAKDAIRYLRNPNKCEIAYSNELCKTSLSVLYRSLKLAGFIKSEYKKWQTKFSPDYKPMRDSRQTLESFFESHPEYESTYKDLSDLLGIPLRTINYLIRQLKRQGRLETRLIGRAKTRKTVFILRSAYKEYLNTLPFNGVVNSGNGMVIHSEISPGKEKKELDGGFSQAWGRAKAVGFSRGVRNLAFFGFALWLSASKRMGYEEVFKELYSVLILTSGFSRREFEKTLKSACRDKYCYCISRKKFESVFVSLGLGGVH